MEKIKLTKEEFETLYEIAPEEKPEDFATDTTSKEDIKEEPVLTEEEEKQDDLLGETLGWVAEE